MVTDPPRGKLIILCDASQEPLTIRLRELARNEDYIIDTLPVTGINKLPETLHLALKELNQNPLLPQKPRMRPGQVSRNPHPMPSVPERRRKKK